MKGLSIGRVVRFVLPKGRSTGEPRAAVIVRVGDTADGRCNLHVFLDGQNDDGADVWATSVPYSEEPKHGTWHWPPKV